MGGRWVCSSENRKLTEKLTVCKIALYQTLGECVLRYLEPLGKVLGTPQNHFSYGCWCYSMRLEAELLPCHKHMVWGWSWPHCSWWLTKHVQASPKPLCPWRKCTQGAWDAQSSGAHCTMDGLVGISQACMSDYLVAMACCHLIHGGRMLNEGDLQWQSLATFLLVPYD